MFCLEGKVRYSELDADAKMSLPAVLSRLQDCCIFDSEEIGMGLHFLAGVGALFLAGYYMPLPRFWGADKHIYLAV